MFRRGFTIVSVLAFVLLLTVRLMGEGDPRYSLLGFGIVLHPEDRLAIHPPSGGLWVFNYAFLYVPVFGCFVVAAVWNIARLHRKQNQLLFALLVILSGVLCLAFGSLRLQFIDVPAIGSLLILSLLAFVFFVVMFIVISFRQVSRRRVGTHSYRYCAWCGYDLTGNISGTCPECGTPIAQNREANA